MNAAIDYSDKLKDPRWQKKRLEVLQAGKWQCAICQSKDKTLHVHHLVYYEGHEPWEYENKALFVVCEDCHDMIHRAHFTGIQVLLLRATFIAGARHSIKMINTLPEDSEEYYEYLKTLDK